MKRTNEKKLHLHRQTLRQLNARELAVAAGGAASDWCTLGCPGPSGWFGCPTIGCTPPGGGAGGGGGSGGPPIGGHNLE
jgi:hypothetical protein